jgi:alcohol dehydrogenase class IV
MNEAFRHVDSARTIVFGPAALTGSAELLGEGYTLLSTPRAAASAPEVLERAATVIEVPAGQVDLVAAQLRGTVMGSRLVALGGGRVIDVAKALAAADPPRDVVAIPTSLSAAEMTAVHRHAQGVAPSTPRVRPAVVINDPQLSASQPAEALAASSANALGHAMTALLSDRTTPYRGR